MNPPLVSIITPTRNRRALLEETIASVRAQTFADWEHLIVDDASSDDTRERIRPLGAADPRLNLIPLGTPCERAAARNTGLARARGQFVLFLDDDDHLHPAALAAHLSTLQSQPAALASVGGYEMFDADGNARRMPVTRRARRVDARPAVLFGWVPVSGQWLFRTETIRRLDGWDSAHIPIEDHVLLLQLTRLGRVALLPQIVLRYRVHPGQWRPANLEEMMTAVRERAAQGDPAAGKILAARACFQRANAQYWQGSSRTARRLYWQACRAAPALLRNPITRGMLLPPLLKSAAGRWGIRWGGKLRTWLRKISGREVQASVQITEPKP